MTSCSSWTGSTPHRGVAHGRVSGVIRFKTPLGSLTLALGLFR